MECASSYGRVTLFFGDEMASRGSLKLWKRVCRRGALVPAMSLLAAFAATSAGLFGGGCLVEFSSDRDSGVEGDVSADVVSHCGNAVREGDEACDGDDFNGLTCASLGLASGRLVCTSHCVIDTSGCVGRCGNGIREEGEDCDGDDLGGMTCDELGFAQGSLACSQDCSFDVTDCDVSFNDCGDGLTQGAEYCDATDLRGLSCASLGYQSGSLRCGNNCMLVTSGCQGDDETCDAENDSCDSCSQCSVEPGGVCHEAWSACGSSQDCTGLVDCFSGCQGDAGCMDTCADAHPNGMALYTAAKFCLFCNACPTNCNSYGICQ